MPGKPERAALWIEDLAATLRIAVVLAPFARVGLTALGYGVQGAHNVIVSMIAVVHADPATAWRKRQSFSAVALQAVIGTAIGAAVAALLPL